MENSIKVAGGKITCRRCIAISKRTKKQCGRPALKTSAKQKCQFHGGRSTGPKTNEGRVLIAKAHTTHGRETKAKRLDRSEKMLWFAHIEDVMHVLKMTDCRRQPGRKPSGYYPITTIEHVRAFIEVDKTLG